MLEDKIDLSSIGLNGFRKTITQPVIFNLKVADCNGQIHSLKLPKHSHEDLLCLYALITASHYSEKAIVNAIEKLINREDLIQCESLETYEKGCTVKTNQSIEMFCDKYGLPLGNLLYVSGKFTLQCEHFRSSVNLTKSDGSNEYFVGAFTWFMTLMFGDKTVKQYVSDARKHINPEIRYEVKNTKLVKRTA